MGLFILLHNVMKYLSHLPMKGGSGEKWKRVWYFDFVKTSTTMKTPIF